MTPPTQATLRKSAALLHAVPGLRATVSSGGQRLATVAPGGEPEQPGARICSPCQFRRTIVAACAHLAIGDLVGVFGLPAGMDPRIDLYTAETCQLRPNGIVSWQLDEETRVLCFATLLDVDTAMAVASEHRSIRSAADPDPDPEPEPDSTNTSTSTRTRTRTRTRDGEPVAISRCGSRVDFFHDIELEITLVYTIIKESGIEESGIEESGIEESGINGSGSADAGIRAVDRATGALFELMALYGAEEIAADPSLLVAVGR